MATDYYFGGDGAVDNSVQGSDAAYFNNSKVPYIKASQLRDYAAIVYSEAASQGVVNKIQGGQNVEVEMMRESFAIAQTMFNYVIVKNAALSKAGKGNYGLKDLLVDKNYTKGLDSPAHQEYYGTAGDTVRRKMATLAILKLFTKNVGDVTDITNAGTLYWDGKDVFEKYKQHYRAKGGFELAHPNMGRLYENLGVQTISSVTATDPKVSAKRKYTYQAVLVAGGTIFYKIHPEAAAQGITW